MTEVEKILNQKCQRKDVSQGTLMTRLLRRYANLLHKDTCDYTWMSLSQTIGYGRTRN